MGEYSLSLNEKGLTPGLNRSTGGGPGYDMSKGGYNMSKGGYDMSKGGYNMTATITETSKANPRSRNQELFEANPHMISSDTINIDYNPAKSQFTLIFIKNFGC